MIANVNDRREVERFMRFAGLHELSTELERLNRLLAAKCHSEFDDQLKVLAGRINHELRSAGRHEH
jgi:hypothetical protein